MVRIVVFLQLYLFYIAVTVVFISWNIVGFLEYYSLLYVFIIFFLGPHYLNFYIKTDMNEWIIIYFLIEFFALFLPFLINNNYITIFGTYS